MIGDKKVIAIIPARGGSKGLPGKNIKPLCGKPLIVWSIEKALKSRFIDVLVVSTDSQQIADIATNAGATVPFLRPEELATDNSPTIDVVEHVLDYFSAEETQPFQSFDYVILLEPTSPIREDEDIDNMVNKLHERAEVFDSIVSMGEVAEHPAILKKLSGENIEPFCPALQQTMSRQDNLPVFFPYGVAYIVKTKSLMSERTFYTQRCTHYLVKRYQNYEIDDIYDFLAVENVIRYEWDLK